MITAARLLAFLWVALISVQGTSAGSDAERPRALALVGGTVISMTGADPQPNTTVVIEGGRIVAVGAPDDVDVPADAVQVDAHGQYLIPGLWDMHVHILSRPGLDLAMPLLIANGITGVRDMNGRMTLEELQLLRAQIDSGDRVGPRLIAPGPLLDGPGRSASALGPNVVAVATEEEAREAVRSLKSRGADFIKVYNRLTPELYAAVMDEAARLQIDVAGHVPHQLDAGAVSDAGQRSIEHLGGVLEDSSSAGAELRSLFATLMAELKQQDGRPTKEQIDLLFAARRDVIDRYDEGRFAELVARFKKNGTWHCPTLVSNRALALAETERSFANDDRLRYVPRSLHDGWFDGRRSLPWDDPAARHRRYGRQLALVGSLNRAGVGLLAGTDLGVAHIYAGFSLHDELVLLGYAGLSPMAALQAATRNPAEFLGLLEETGTIEVGKAADLVLLEKDPLEDLSNTGSISAVVRAGVLLDRPALDRLLAEAEQLAAEM